MTRGVKSKPAPTPPDWGAVITDLRQQLTTAEARRGALAERRKTLALEAHLGTAEAQAALVEIGKDQAVVAGEIEDLTAAIADAERRQSLAVTEAEQAAERERAREILALLEDRKKLAADFDTAVAALVSAAAAYVDSGIKLRGLSPKPLSDFAIRGLAKAAIETSFIGMTTAHRIQGFALPATELRKPLSAHTEHVDKVHRAWASATASPAKEAA